MPTEIDDQAAGAAHVAPAIAATHGEQADARFGEITSFLSGRKRFVLAGALAGAAIAAGVAALLPNTYTATAVVMPPQKEQSTASLLIGQLGPLAAVAGADLALKNPADLYLGLLGSRTISDHIISKFRLKPIYGAKSDTDARNALRNRARFRTGRDSLIRIDVEDVDPSRAAAMANAFVSELDEQNRRLAVTDAGQRRLFLEGQLRQVKSDLTASEERMKTTQHQTGLIEVTGQTQATIASIAQLRAQITAGEVGLARMRIGATPANPAILQAQAELEALRGQLRKLEKSPSDGSAIVAAGTIPDAAIDYMRRLRQLKYDEFLFELLSKQYEAARLDESKAVPALQVIDSAIPPDKKSGPPRALIGILGSLGGAALGIAAAYTQARRSGPRPAGRA